MWDEAIDFLCIIYCGRRNKRIKDSQKMVVIEEGTEQKW